MTEGLGFEAEVSADTRRYVSEMGKATGSTDKFNAAAKAASVDIQKLQSQYNSFKTDSLTKAQRASGEAQIKYAQQARNAGVAYGQEINNSLSGTRYALYDVASTWGAVSAATLGAAVAVEGVGIKYESAFASVERTSGAAGAQLAQLREDLIGISTSMPAAFGDVTAIATLGAQLGIASQNLDGFTENIAQFAATTDVSTEAASIGFGRLAQLTDAGQENFNKLTSAVYEVGVNSVATESQILKVSQEIATAGDLAGFSAAEVIGLAGALASLGVQPERARGNVLRIFNELNVAVAEGGENLQQFANLSGMSADDFATAWQDTPERAFNSLILGLNRAAESGAALDIVIKDLGITAVRDVQTLQQLANNTEVYAQSQSDASRAYAEGTALADGYGIVAETTAAKLQVLANTVLAVADAASELGVVKEVVDFLQGLAEGLLEIVNTPVGGTITAITLGIAAMIGVLAAAVAGAALFRASIYAMITAQQGMARSTGVATLSLRQMAGQMLALSGLARTATGATVTLTGALKTLATGTLVTAGLTLAFEGVSAVVGAVAKTFESASDKAENLFGDLTGLAEALKADTAAGVGAATTIRTITAETTSSSTSLSEWAQNLQTAAGVQVQLSDGTTTTTENVKKQTIAIGENARAWLASSLANNATLQKFYQENQAVLSDLGFSLQDFFNAALNTEGGAAAYIEDLNIRLETMRTQAVNAAGAQDDFGYAMAEAEGKAAEYSGKLITLGEIAAGIDGAFSSQTAAVLFNEQVMDAAGVTVDNTANSQYDLAEATGMATGTLQEQVDAIMGLEGGTVALQNALFGLGESIAQNGTSFDIYSVSGRANFEALQAVISAAVKASGDDATALATHLQGIMNALGGFGVNVAQQVPSMTNLLNNLTGGKGTSGLKGVSNAATTAGSALGQGFSSGAAKASKAAQKAAKQAKEAAAEIRTLSDYVSDLSGVFDKSFDIRFGYEKSIDAVSDALDTLTKHSEDAQKRVADAFDSLAKAGTKIDDLRQDILDLDATIAGLRADRNVLEYQLGIAVEYGDTLRAEAILADLAKTNADLAGVELDRKQTVDELGTAQKDYSALTKELSDAQAALKRTLDGNSQSAREQRTAVLSLVQAYQQQVVALANSGASQDVIRTKTAQLQSQFEAQMRQLGYNSAEVARYSATFNDLTYAINNVPRNITVGANMDPAQRALAEYLARVNNSTANVRLTATGGGVYNASGINLGNGAITSNEIKTNAVYARQGGAGNLYQRIAAGGGLINPIYRAGGGSTVAGLGQGPQGTDTIPAWLTPGEFVQRRAAVQHYGLPFMNALNNMQLPRYFAMGGSTAQVSSPSLPGTLMVELSPTDRALLAANGNVTVTIDGKVVANAVNSSNTQNARRNAH